MMHMYVCSRDMCFLWSWWVLEAPTTTISWGCLLWLSQRLLLDGFRFGASSQWIFKWSLVATKLHGTRHVDGRVPKDIFLIFGGDGVGWGMLPFVWSCTGRMLRCWWGRVGMWWGMLPFVWSCTGWMLRGWWGRVGMGWVMLPFVWSYTADGGGFGWGGSCYPSCEAAQDGCYAADGGGLGWGGACYPSREVAQDGCYTADVGGLGWGGSCYPSCEVAQDGCYAADGGGLAWGAECYNPFHVKLHRTDATRLMGEGWGGVGHVTLRVKLHRTHGRTCVQHFLAALARGVLCVAPWRWMAPSSANFTCLLTICGMQTKFSKINTAFRRKGERFPKSFVGHNIMVLGAQVRGSSSAAIYVPRPHVSRMQTVAILHL